MIVEEVKKQLAHMEAPILQELSTFILQLRRQHDPSRKKEISSKLDSTTASWLSLDEMDQRLNGQ